MADSGARKNLRALIALALFAAASLWLTYRAHQLAAALREAREDGRFAALLHQPAPDFTLPLLLAAEGQPAEVAIADLKGKIVLISFWASWCRPCHIEMPLLNQYYLSRRHQGVEVIAISTDSDREAALRYARDNRFAFPMVWDAQDTVANQYRIKALPTLVIVDPNGRITRFEEGARFNLEAWLDAQIAAIHRQGREAKKSQAD